MGKCEASVVSDSGVDVRMARNYCTWCCGVSYGLKIENMRAHPPGLQFDNLVELSAHLNDLRA